MPGFSTYNLSLADGTHIVLSAIDQQADVWLEFFSNAAQLKKGDGPGQHIILSTNENSFMARMPDGSVFRFTPFNDGMIRSRFLFGLSHVISWQARDGMLLHGALAEHKNRGVLLIAKGGTGKTTSSKRLPLPWSSLSDDLALIVRDASGEYWAHPWPTWSSFFEGGEGGKWDVKRMVPLHAVYQLLQAGKDWVEPLGTGESIISLMQSAEQAFLPVRRSFDPDYNRQLRLQRFNHVCALARCVPTNILHISLRGSFWLIMEDSLR